MGIGGLDSEFSTIFRRAFASRVFPPGLVDKLGIQHVKGTTMFNLRCNAVSERIIYRYSAPRAPWYWKDTYGETNR